MLYNGLLSWPHFPGVGGSAQRQEGQRKVRGDWRAPWPLHSPCRSLHCISDSSEVDTNSRNAGSCSPAFIDSTLLVVPLIFLTFSYLLLNTLGTYFSYVHKLASQEYSYIYTQVHAFLLVLSHCSVVHWFPVGIFISLIASKYCAMKILWHWKNWKPYHGFLTSCIHT